MPRYYLSVQITSDAVFSRGSGLAGLVDVEIEHDAITGLPYIDGRSLKGLLVEEWANMRSVLPASKLSTWDPIASWLFGTSGAANAHMHIGAATLAPELQAHLKNDIVNERITAQDILASLTTIRSQTAINAKTGAPDNSSLRAIRMLIRETDLIAPLDFDQNFEHIDATLGLLAACVLAVRRGGLGRNRGRGHLALRLHAPGKPPDDYRNSEYTHRCFQSFGSEVRS